MINSKLEFGLPKVYIMGGISLGNSLDSRTKQLAENLNCFGLSINVIPLILEKNFKDIQIVYSEFDNEFPTKCITMIVLEGFTIHIIPIENYIFIKPHDASSKENKYLVGNH